MVLHCEHKWTQWNGLCRPALLKVFTRQKDVLFCASQYHREELIDFCFDYFQDALSESEFLHPGGKKAMHIHLKQKQWIAQTFKTLKPKVYSLSVQIFVPSARQTPCSDSAAQFLYSPCHPISHTELISLEPLWLELCFKF